MKKTWTTRLGALAVVGAVAAGGYAYTAANTVPTTSSGVGSAAISGYAVTNVQYGLNATTPTNIDSVTFDINPTAATVVKAQLAAAGTYYPCTNVAGAVTCTTTAPQATVAGATQLTVVASQ